MSKNTKSSSPLNSKRTSVELTAALETFGEELRKVRDIECIIGEPAVIKGKELQQAIAVAQKELSVILADEAEERRKALLASFSDVFVTTTYGPGSPETVVHANFKITYERGTYDMHSKQSVPVRHTCNGFDALPDPVWDYLLEVRQDAIPAAIMALAPGEPRKAFADYFQAKRRGYLSAPAENGLASA